MHLRVWFIGRMERLVLAPLALLYRSAPLMAFALRQLGAKVGKNLQCSHDAALSGPLDLITIGDDVAIQTGAYIHTARWSGQHLLVGPVRLESGCKIGMRAAVAGGVTVGRGAWITPFTPALADVGAQEMWEGAPARRVGRCTHLVRTANACRNVHPIWLLEGTNLFMQLFISFWLRVLPAAAILWLARDLIPADTADFSAAYFMATPLPEVIGRLTLYGFVTTWLTLVVTSVLTCVFIRCTATRPGLYPSHGLRGALLLYRMSMMNRIQQQWTWTITGQYLRALAGMRFPRTGGSECDIMFNLVPELTAADSVTFWSNGCFTNMLDYGAEHIALRRLDLPRNFFSGNNCVAEHGQLPSDFLLGVSTPCSDIRFRRQMRSRLGDPITVVGNPPVRFASASFEAENESERAPGFLLFATRMLLNDFAGIGMLRATEGLMFAILSIGLLRSGLGLVASTIVAVLLAEIGLVVLAVTGRHSGPGGTSPTSSPRTVSSSGAEVRWASAPAPCWRTRFCGGSDAGSAGARS
jgi:non-ribosomal peptide synthetase-like protein